MENESLKNRTNHQKKFPFIFIDCPGRMYSNTIHSNNVYEKIENMSKFDSSEVWGPHYWFFLYTIAFHYPLHPNTVLKRKYYDFIMNLPLFIPDEHMGDEFASLLDEYPVTPYLYSQISLVKWVWFIHNKINEKLGKEEISLQESIDQYLQHITQKQKREKKIYTKIVETWNKHYSDIILFFFFIFIVFIALKHKDIYKK